MNRLIDISRPLTPRTAVWPGDIPFRAKAQWSIPHAAVTVHTLTMTTHFGTHTDAPNHVLGRGKAIHQVPLEAYLGPAYVVTVPGTTPLAPSHLVSALNAHAKRILVRSHSSLLAPSAFPKNYSHVTPEAARLLVKHRLLLLGVDGPSIDPFYSKHLEAHKILFRGGIAVLENLYLRRAKNGWYQLTALPLSLQGLDASPVRAVLTPLLRG